MNRKTTFTRRTTFSKPRSNQPNGLGMILIDKLYDAVTEAISALDAEGIESSYLIIGKELYDKLMAEYMILGASMPDKFCGLAFTVDDSLVGMRYTIGASATSDEYGHIQ